MKIILSISLKLNFTPNTSGCYGLRLYTTTQVIENASTESSNARATQSLNQANVVITVLGYLTEPEGEGVLYAKHSFAHQGERR